MKNGKVIDAVVVRADSNVAWQATFEGSDVLAQRVTEEIRQFKLLEREASWRALRIGILLHKAKLKLKHGEYIPWCEKMFPEYGREWLHRFVQLAEVFLRSQKLDMAEAMMLCAPKLQKPEAERIDRTPSARPVQLAFAFLGDLSINELLRKHHIREGLPTGGNHRELVEKLKQENFEELCAIVDWKKICEALFKHGLDKKSWAHLPNQKKLEVFDLIEAVRTAMKPVVVALKQTKRG